MVGGKEEGATWWYLVTTRETQGTLAAEVWRTRRVTSFDWEAPGGWREDDVTAAAFLSPSKADQVPVPAPWHPDTRAIVEGNGSKVQHALNDNVSDLDLCTFEFGNGTIATILYYAWGDQQLGPTAMVLSMGLVWGQTEEQVLAASFA